MNQPKELFRDISIDLCLSQDVHSGKMISAPGLKFNNKEFAFFNKDSMGFRLGPDFDPKDFGIRNAKPLSPFKKKPLLKGWYILEYDESNFWKKLSEESLRFTKTLK